MKNRRTFPTSRIVLTVLFLACVTPGVGHAALTLDWWTVDGGGATRVFAGQAILAGTAGQPDAGVHSVGTLVLSGGFWRGGRAPTGVPEEDTPEAPPLIFRLHSAVPNPFNPRTTFAFDLPAASDCRLEIFDLVGRRIRTLVQGTMEPGRHEAIWDGRDGEGRIQGSGVYLAQLVAGKDRSVQKVVLLK